MNAQDDTQISTLRLSDQIAADLRRRIYSGTYRPGHRLVEAELSREFGVSRAPLREALVTLEREGLVVVAPYRGAVVARLDEDDMLEIQQIRIALEGLAARRVAELGDGSIAQLLQERLETMAAAARGSDSLALTEAHMNFHRSIAEASRLPRLVEILDQLARQSHAFRSYATLSGPALKKVINDHRRLVDALESGNPDVAQAAVLLHISARHEPIAALLEAAKRVTDGHGGR